MGELPLDNDAVIEAELDERKGTLRVRNWANATVFGDVNRSDRWRLGNVSSYKNGDLKLNIRRTGQKIELNDFEDF